MTHLPECRRCGSAARNDQVVLSYLQTTDGNLVELSVQDNGPGIADEHREQIFEPFFTTKKDVGTGLGLWVSKEIVDRHGGSIQVLSINGESATGTVFKVHLPVERSNLSTRGAAGVDLLRPSPP